MTREEQIIEAAEKATYQEPPQYSELVHKARKVMCAYEVGFIDGCVWADSHPHWIPVEERLPNVDDCGNSDFYLVHDFGESDHVAYYCKTDNEWYTENGESVFPTHWMEIVPPRKED